MTIENLKKQLARMESILEETRTRNQKKFIEKARKVIAKAEGKLDVLEENKSKKGK